MKSSGRIVTYLFILLGTGLILAGVVEKQYIEVCRNAVQICLECIGIG